MTPQERKNFEWVRDNMHGEQERSFCERCGKRLVDGSIHTCTPPAEQAQKQEPWPEEPAGHMAGGVKPSNMTRSKAITQIYALFGAPHNADINLTGLSMLLDELMDSSPKQKQEPVGRFSKFTDGLWKEVTATSAGQPLYAAPPQRQWVGLTDEEVHECLNGLPTQTIDVYARRIEAKLKEKNSAS